MKKTRHRPKILHFSKIEKNNPKKSPKEEVSFGPFLKSSGCPKVFMTDRQTDRETDTQTQRHKDIVKFLAQLKLRTDLVVLILFALEIEESDDDNDHDKEDQDDNNNDYDR